MTKEELIKLKEEVLQYKKVNEIEKIIPKMSAYQYLLDCSKDRMECYALNYLGRLYTYKELFNEIDIAARAFMEKGVSSGDVVAMAMLSTPEAIISFYALNKIGATVYMVNGTHEKPAIREELLDSGAKILVINDIFYDKDVKAFADEANIETVVAASLDDTFPICFYQDKLKFKLIKALKSIGNACNSDKRCIRWKELRKIGEKSRVNVEPYYEKGCSMLIASTSGSTGKPKRPVITNESINIMPIQMGMSCDSFAPNDSIFTTLPTWIVYSISNSIHEPLCLGVRVDLDPIFNSKKVSKRFKQYRPNHWNSIPSYIEDMKQDKGMRGLDLSFIKSITTGGDFRSPKLKIEGERILKENNSNCEIGQGYGLTETGGCFGYTYESGMTPESIGKPLIGNAYKIVDDETGEELGPNAVGGLYLYTPAVMKEYFKNSEATDEVLIKDEDGIIWYKTDDMSHYDERGQLFLDGRKRRIEISRDGNGTPTKVFPDKVKQVVSLHPNIEQCEIIMVPDDKRITKPIAYIVLKEGTIMDSRLISEIVELCYTHNIERYTIPVDFKVIDEIPRNESKKVDYNALMELYQSSSEKKEKRKILSLFKNKLS